MRKTANVVSIGRACLAILGVVALGAASTCAYSADPANGHGLRCWPGDEPRCPDGFSAVRWGDATMCYGTPVEGLRWRGGVCPRARF